MKNILKEVCRKRHIEFYDYNGLAGDEHLLLIGENEMGVRMATLYNRMYWSKLSYWWAKRKLVMAFSLLLY